MRRLATVSLTSDPRNTMRSLSSNRYTSCAGSIPELAIIGTSGGVSITSAFSFAFTISGPAIGRSRAPSDPTSAPLSAPGADPARAGYRFRRPIRAHPHRVVGPGSVHPNRPGTLVSEHYVHDVTRAWRN